MGTMVTRNLEPEQAKEKITFKTYISYALGDTGDNIMFSTVSSLLVLFYTDYIGLSPVSYTHLDGIYAETADGNVKMTGYDTMILALGYQKYNPLQNAAEKVCSEVHVVGDAAGARNAKFAIYEGAKLGLAL